MKRRFLALLAGLATTSVAAQPVFDGNLPPRSCMEAIKALRYAGDCQNNGLFHELYWPGAVRVAAGGEPSPFANARLFGPCPKYRTYLRDLRKAPVVGNRQTIRLKSIVTRVATDGRYSGDYSVFKVSYTCERRGKEWRVLRQDIFTRGDFVNARAATEFERTGGWEGRH
ncbi:hypothetical protein [Parerythrobacter aestuarii]|uniref:hypothetical protein n=1 Tax=Parerythrobacter aestuarii TaxID=3020909 RepID=UPI0024DEBB49|nr:hypothetical protein [Parerythrobacter aestuarii]